MRILIVTDAWFPQTNGVVHTLAQTAAWLGRFGHEVRLITPQDFRTFPCPTYPEIRISVFPYKQVAKTIARFSRMPCTSRRKARWGWPRAATASESQSEVHDFVSHAVPAVFEGAVSDSAVGVVCGAHVVSQRRRALHGEHEDRAGAARGARLQEARALAAWCGYGRSFVLTTRRFSICRGRSLLMSGALLSRRTSMRFCACRGRDPRS